MFLGKTLYSYDACLHPGALIGTGELNAVGLPCDGRASHPWGSRNTPTVPLRYTLTVQTCESADMYYTNIRAWLYAHTRMIIRTCAHGYTRIRM